MILSLRYKSVMTKFPLVVPLANGAQHAKGASSCGTAIIYVPADEEHLWTQPSKKKTTFVGIDVDITEDLMCRVIIYHLC